MRLPRWTPVVIAAALALTAGGVAAAAGQDRGDAEHGTAGSGVVNVNGHEVDEHAAFGQETAAQARARGDEADDAEDQADDQADLQADDETDETEDPTGADDEADGGAEEHGRSGEEHGHGHGWAFGHLSPEARKAAVADMQAAHHEARPEQAHGRSDGPAHGRPQGR